MEFIIDTAELQRIIGVLGVTARSNTTEPSGLILIEAYEDNSVLFLSNNNSTGISITSQKTIVNEPGNLVITYGKIKSFITSVTPYNDTYGAKEFHLKYTDDAGAFITVESINENGKKSKGVLKLDTYDIFSVKKPEPFEKPTFILNSSIFKTALNKVLYAIDPHDARPFIRGMNIHFDDEYIYFAGTNGTRLSEYTIKNISELRKGSFIFQYDFLMGLKRALGDETQIFFELNDRKVKTNFDGIYFWGKLIIGEEYPDYSPNFVSFTDEITLQKDILISLLLPFTDVLDSDDYNRITFSIANRKLKILNDYLTFDYEAEIDYDKEFAIDVDGQSLIETINAIKDDTLVIKFSHDMGCIIFDSDNFEDQKALVTPIRRR